MLIRIAIAAINGVIAWERFRTSVAEAEALMRPEEFDVYENVGELPVLWF